MNAPKPSSISRKILVPFFAAAALLVAAAIFGAARMVDVQVSKRLSERAGSICAYIGDVAEHVGSMEDLQRVVSAMAAEKDVVLIALAGGPDRTVLAASDRSMVGDAVAQLGDRDLAEKLDEAMTTKRLVRRIYRGGDFFGEASFIRLAVPELTQLAPVDGAVAVRLSAAAIHAEERRAVWQLAAYAAAALLLMMGFGYWLLARYVLKPLDSIKEQLRSAAGELAPIDSGSSRNDQIGAVAEALN